MTAIPWFGITDLVSAICTRELSPVEIVRAHLDRIERLDGRLKSYLSVFADQALAAARSAEATVAANEELGALHGVPVAVKDLFDVAGTPTTAGSTFMTRPAQRDCTVVERLRAAGAIILGKLNMHEFAYGPEGINPHHGTPWNPWDANVPRMPGGSSSGSGVAVAAGLTPMALGSDTGGSIRIPAACCGTVGLKPTYGHVSRAGVLPLAWSLDHAGPLTRSVADAAFILDHIAAHDPADPASSQMPSFGFFGSLRRPMEKWRVGVYRAYFERSSPEVKSAVEAAARVLADLGCELRDIDIPTEKYGLAVAYALCASEALVVHEPLLRQHSREYAPDVRRRIAVGRFLSATDYLKGQKARRLIRDDVNRVLQEVDCLLAPTLPVAAPPITASEVRIGSRTEGVRLAFTMFTRLFNLSGHPVISLPCGFSAEGMPLSMQIVGRAFEEATILRLAHAYENATDWHKRRPPLEV
jgi:aspartyl-tRNA(Asn)/glutamyl-tRNA(Gln) amidotransferase subunit A